MALTPILTGGFLIADVVGDLITGGLALVDDAGHALTDEEWELGETYL